MCLGLTLGVPFLTEQEQAGGLHVYVTWSPVIYECCPCCLSEACTFISEGLLDSMQWSCTLGLVEGIPSFFVSCRFPGVIPL